MKNKDKKLKSIYKFEMYCQPNQLIFLSDSQEEAQKQVDKALKDKKITCSAHNPEFLGMVEV